jgi:hypothetical protein
MSFIKLTTVSHCSVLYLHSIFPHHLTQTPPLTIGKTQEGDGAEQQQQHSTFHKMQPSSLCPPLLLQSVTRHGWAHRIRTSTNKANNNTNTVHTNKHIITPLLELHNPFRHIVFILIIEVPVSCRADHHPTYWVVVAVFRGLVRALPLRLGSPRQRGCTLRLGFRRMRRTLSNDQPRRVWR